MKRIWIILPALILLIGGGCVVKTLYDAGQFKKITPHFNGDIREVYGVTGGEDITIHPRHKVAYISADDRFANMQGRNVRGGIYRYAFPDEDARPVIMPDDLNADFHPHGISLLTGHGDSSWLFVVNHRRDGHFIERFYIDGHRLKHEQSFQSGLMVSPNDVVAISKNAFYFTNDHGSASPRKQRLEDYLQLPKSNVVYYDGSTYRTVAEGIRFANGINISKDGRLLYVAGTIDKSLFIFQRDAGDGSLKLVQTLELNTGVDNIEIDPQGNLWIGAHPKLLTFVKHAKDITHPAPSEVIKVYYRDGEYQWETVFLDNGERLSASSVAAASGEHLLIGPVFDDHILHCIVE